MIDSPFVRNALLAAGSMLVGALAAGLSVLMVQLAGTDPVNFRPILAAALGPIVTGLMVRQLTKAGREDVAVLVNQVGVPQAKAALEGEVARQETGALPALSDADIDRLARRGLELMHGTPDPDPLPPIPRYPRS